MKEVVRSSDERVGVDRGDYIEALIDGRASSASSFLSERSAAALEAYRRVRDRRLRKTA